MRALTCLFFTCLLLAGCGVTAPSHDAGYADVDGLGWQQVDHNLSFSLGPTLLSMAAAMVEDDPKTQRLLRSLEGVRVKVYDVEAGKAEAVNEKIQQMQSDLVAQAWEPVVLVQEQNETTHLLVKMEGEQIRGITVLNTDGVEAIFVNVMGELQPEMFSQTVAALKVPAPEVKLAASEP